MKGVLENLGCVPSGPVDDRQIRQVKGQVSHVHCDFNLCLDLIERSVVQAAHDREIAFCGALISVLRPEVVDCILVEGNFI